MDESMPSPISREECRQIADERGELYFNAYRCMGGWLPWAQYRDALIQFLYETHDIYITGYPVRHNSRNEAMGAVQRWLREYAPGESAGRIFQSVDSVDAYT